MMVGEDIEKAAKKYANENAYIPSDGYAENNMIEMKESFAETFKDGAEWRINSVWHTNKVKPTSANLIIRKSRKDEYDLGYVLAYDTVVWAYVKDLLPNVE